MGNIITRGFALAVLLTCSVSHAQVAPGAVWIAVRSAAEFAEGHVPGAQNIPHTELAARIAELEVARARDVVVYCRSGVRAAQALTVLQAAGFKRLFHLQGDYQRWAEAGRPVATRPQ